MKDTSNSLLTNCTFQTNSATTTGGALGLSGIEGLTLNSTIFTGNTASTGSAVFATNTHSMQVTKNLFVGNVAEIAGGFYWEVNTMAEPHDLSSRSNRWLSNVASYGADYATQVAKLSSNVPDRVVYHGGDMLPSVQILSADYYNQTVLSDNSTFISAVARPNCSELGYLAGGEIAAIARGSTRFDAMQVFNYTLPPSTPLPHTYPSQSTHPPFPPTRHFVSLADRSTLSSPRAPLPLPPLHSHSCCPQ